MGKRRVLVAEDHRMVFEGISNMLANEYEFIGHIVSGRKVLDAVREKRPHLLILDLDLPDRHGTEVLPEVRAHYPHLPILILTVQNSPEVMEEVIRLGATGFLPKGVGVKELRAAMEDCLAGQIHRSPEVTALQTTPPVHPHDKAIAGTSPIRQKMFELIGQGRSASDVAKLVGMSRWSVYYHRRELRRLLHVNSEKSLDRAAMEWVRRRQWRKAEPHADPGRGEGQQ